MIDAMGRVELPNLRDINVGVDQALPNDFVISTLPTTYRNLRMEAPSVGRLNFEKSVFNLSIRLYYSQYSFASKEICEDAN